MTTLTAKRAELAEKQAVLHRVFTEAKTAGGELDLGQIKSLGDNLTPHAKAEQIQALNRELDAIGREVEALAAADTALKAAADREAQRTGYRHPTGGEPDQPRQRKSLGRMVTESAEYKAWLQRGRADGVTIRLDDIDGSDLLAAAKNFPTLERKLFSTTAGWAPESPRMPGFVEAAARPIQLLDIIPLSRTGADSLTYMEETVRTHAAAETVEGAAYPTSVFTLTPRTSPVRKIGDSIPVTDEQLEDVPQVESYLEGRLQFGVRQRLDAQVLVGAGTGVNLRGLLNTVGIQTRARGADPIPDAFFRAMTQVRITGRAAPTHIVMHPTNWETVRLLRGAGDIYVWGPPSDVGPARMWGLPVVLSDAGAAGTGYVGSFSPEWVTLAERRGVEVQIGYVGNQFAEGRRTMRADGRWAFVVFRPAALCTVTGI